MSSSENKKLGDIVMETYRMGHECEFTWRLRNVSFISQVAKGDIKHVFSLHPKCDTKWTLCASGHRDNLNVDLRTFSITGPPMGPESYIGFLDRKGKFVQPKSSVLHPNFGSDSLCFGLKLDGNSVTLEDGKVVAMEDGDTMVVKGKVVVPDCCVRTDIVKEELVDVPASVKSENLDLCELIKNGFFVVV